MSGETTLQVVVTQRRQRSAAVFDDTGCAVHITMMCPKCHVVRTLAMFGLRKMADGTVRNQPWCRPCRSRSTKALSPEAQSTEQP